MKYSDFLTAEAKRPCPFCSPKPEEIILESKLAYLTFALAPYHADHLLTVPRRHIEHILDITEEELNEIDALQDRGWALLEKLGYKSVTYLVREGETSGRSVTHVHYHVIPDVRIGDMDHKGDDRKVLGPKEIAEVMERFKKIV